MQQFATRQHEKNTIPNPFPFRNANMRAIKKYAGFRKNNNGKAVEQKDFTDLISPETSSCRCL